MRPEEKGSSVRPGTRQFILEVVVPSIRQQLADIRELGFPEGDEETIEGILTDAEAVLDQTESDLESVGPDPFADVNERMAEYGMSECA